MKHVFEAVTAAADANEAAICWAIVELAEMGWHWIDCAETLEREADAGIGVRQSCESKRARALAFRAAADRVARTLSGLAQRSDIEIEG